jgi:hypothetical protein
MLTLEELMERMLTQLDPDDIITTLDITSEELLDKFDYKVQERFEELQDEFD